MSVELLTAPNRHATAPVPVAVIDIGTTAIRMALAEIRQDGQVRPGTTLSQAVSLGKDTG